MSSKYDKKFYSSRHDTTVYSAKVITGLVRELIQPASAVDLGCGVGTWLKVLQENGVEDILGIEGNWVKDEAIVIPLAKFLKTDLAKPLQVEREFQLAISLEVAEHIHEKDADQFINNLTSLAPVILFSAAIPMQGGEHHVNEQWPEYWKEKFSKRNYVLIDCIRYKIWDDPLIAMWYAQNSFLFVRKDKLDAYPKLSPYLNTPTITSVVHPRFYEHRLSNWSVTKALKNKMKRMFK